MAAGTAFATAPVAVSGGWIRLLPGELPLAGYFTLHNNSKRPVRLIGASSPVFKRIELHRSMSTHGMEKMMGVEQVTVAPGKTVRFAPGGYHLMMWRGRSLEVGERVPVTLQLAGGRHVRAVFTVKGPVGKSP
jgi:copper(I)-binding protein